MRKRSDLSSRGEINDNIDKHREDMSVKEDELEIVASDTETVRSTLENLDFGGTEEGADAVESAIEQAEHVTVDIFEQKDSDLEVIQSDTEGYKDELQGHSETAESDLGKISDAGSQVQTGETIEKLADARDNVTEDRDFLNDQVDRAREAREESEQRQQELESRVRI